MASLSAGDVNRLYRCEDKSKRRQLLAKMLNFLPCDSDEDDMKTSILLDFYCESISFVCERGFSWQQGLTVYELMKELLDTTLDFSLLQATEHFKTTIKGYSESFSSQRLISVIDFVFSFFFNHFHLYKFVFRNEREVNKRRTHLIVETPPQDLPALSQGIEQSEWQRQQVLYTLEKQHHIKLMDKQSRLDSEIERLQCVVQNKLSLLGTEQPITEVYLNNVIQETVKIYVEEAGSTIRHMIEENQESLLYEFERSTIAQDFSVNVKASPGKTKSAAAGLTKKKPKPGKVAAKG